MELDDQIAEDRWRAMLVLSLVCCSLGISLAKATRPSREPQAKLARRAAMYVTHVAFGMSTARVGSAFGRDRTTVSHACQLMEKWRDEPRFDRWLDALERSAEAAPAPYRGRTA
jgi:chromosomal replication initiation ATPase DnaA